MEVIAGERRSYQFLLRAETNLFYLKIKIKKKLTKFSRILIFESNFTLQKLF